MKIKRFDGERLILVHCPWLFIVFCLVIATGCFYSCAQSSYHREALTWTAIGLGAAGSIIVLPVFFFARCARYDFDRSRAELRWSRAGLLGKEEGTIPFGQINGASVETSGSNDEVTYRIVLALSNGAFPLTYAYWGGTAQQNWSMSNAINSVLGKPLVTTDGEGDADIQALIKQGRVIAAIKLVRSRRNCSLSDAKTYVESLKR